MKARVFVTLKGGVLDPQGKAVQNALHDLGFSSVTGVRQGKVLEIEMSGQDPAKAKAALDEMCRRLLANTVIENYRIEVP